jgi:hypothetical protein
MINTTELTQSALDKITRITAEVCAFSWLPLLLSVIPGQEMGSTDSGCL